MGGMAGLALCQAEMQTGRGRSAEGAGEGSARNWAGLVWPKEVEQESICSLHLPREVVTKMVELHFP